MDADLLGDIGQAHVAYAVLERELPGRVQDGVLALLFLFGASSPLEGLVSGHNDQSS